VIPSEMRNGSIRSFINPTGRFVVGGPVADAGLTGRKIMVDTYGGYARHGGGCFSGKDPTKVDRAGAYGARHVAKNIVAAELARKCEVQVSYAIGVVKPVAIRVDTFGTGKVPDTAIAAAVSRLFDLSPLGIIKELNLRRPLFRQTAAYGHFGRTDIDGACQGAGGRAVVTTVAVIPAGGSGTRLWPRSRRSTPKHVLPLADRRRPLLRATYDRARAVADEVFVLTETRQREIIEAVLPEVDAAHMILEPSARGTTNAYGLATLTLVERAPGAVMIGLPADHVVHGSAEVARTVRAALRAAAKSDCLVTVGLKPTFPSTGLGYIHAPGRPSAGTRRVREAIRARRWLLLEPRLVLVAARGVRRGAGPPCPSAPIGSAQGRGRAGGGG